MSPRFVSRELLLIRVVILQRNAATTFAPEPSHALAFRTTARARTPMLKRRSNWEKEARSACQREGSKLARPLGRLNWPARVSCDILHFL
jgi:hypothetical protein